VITISEVIEQCARECDKRAKRDFPWASENSDRYHAQADWAEQCAKDIRTLKAKYEGCIVAEGMPEVYCYQLLAEDQVVNELFASINWDVRLKPFGRSGVDHGGVATKTPLYRAKEPTK
jgi:hypothetical protein